MAVVTGRPLEVGATLNDGDILTEVNGRPVFTVASPFAFYRDIGPGDSGPDVIALQTTLAHRGYGVSADGVFGARTDQAVRAWYRDSGYNAPTRAPSLPDADAASERGDGTAAPAEVAYVPVSELQGINSLPISVVRGIAVGDPVGVEGTSDVMLGSPEKVVVVAADPTQMADIAEGDVATIAIDSTEVEARVSGLAPRSTEEEGSVGDGDNSSAEDAARATVSSFTVTPTTPLVDLAPGTPVRVLITRHIVSEEALLVPVIAVTDRGAQNNVILVRRSDGSFVEVGVTVLGALDGQAAVAPDEDGAVSVGDEVKVG
ncbi:peptidoglycan-binding domain-containing protein [Microbacterium ureisolvens]|uniref:Peptidoglycan-binding protein n=1 Tax=Microbacterium ureisolvens TaxID=2781186 RepID=A0ABS7I0N7_9MICO|nr:peptidoglycan-binding domain-containing protein [Microbacterium ureisolvens]MBW9110159.1 peptidoglycan-binding protein [Microbacterium ureisolvens]